MRNYGIYLKYCFNCGKSIQRDMDICQYCDDNQNDYNKYDTIECRYCRNPVPAEATYCKVCCTENPKKIQHADKLTRELQKALNIYQMQHNEENIMNKLSNYKKTLDIAYCFETLGKAKKVFVRANDSEVFLQTLEFGQESISYDDIICCYRIDKSNLKSKFGIEVNEYLSFSKFILINTTKGNIVFTESAEELLEVIYFHLGGNIVEFSDSFYNGSYDEEIQKRYEKETESA